MNYSLFKIYFQTILFILFSFPAFGQVKILVLGSSTAAGTGSSHPDSAWVNRYRNYLQDQNVENEVINLAQGGYTTFHILPTGTTTPSNRPNPDISKNITAALNDNPDAIIINLPSNDAASGFPVSEQLANYDAVLTKANDAGVPVWIATTQGRNLDFFKRQDLIEMRDSTFARFGGMAIDFWTYIGQSNGTLNIIYDSGDGVHLNDNGHKILFERVVGKDIPDVVLTDIDIVQKERPQVKIFPNPAEEILFISFEKNINKKTEVRLIDMSGKKLGDYFIEKNNSELQINISGFQSGAYQLLFSNGSSSWRKMFIKII